MTDREVLLHAIVTNPTDNLPRLQFADLIEQDYDLHDYAELIRCQISIARGEGDEFPCDRCDNGITRTKIPLDAAKSSRRGSSRSLTGRRATVYRNMDDVRVVEGLCVTCNASGKVIDQKELRFKERTLLRSIPNQIAWFPGWDDWALFTGSPFGHIQKQGVVTRGFVSYIELPWADFRRLAPQFLWWEPLDCSACDGVGSTRFCDAAGDMDDRPCLMCGGASTGAWFNGTGKIPGPTTPFSLSVQPVEEVTLLTWPRISYLGFDTYDEATAQEWLRINYPSVKKWSLRGDTADMINDDHRGGSDDRP